jgi:hypothetical protein
MLIGETPLGELPGIGDSFSVNTISYSMDQWTIFVGSEPLEDPPGAIRYYHNRQSDTLLKKSVNLAWDMGYAIANSYNYKTFRMDTGLKDTLRAIDMSMTLAPCFELTVPSTSVLNALVWSWAEALDSVWRQMDTMATALKIDSADSTYLDDAWGQIYDMPRIYQETDTDYRDRLKTRTLVLTSSGTKSNCETIIDSIIGETSTNVTPRYPASVDITFDTVSAMRSAFAKKTVLDMLIPQMLASGITYNMFLPYVDYYIDCYMKGPLTLPYNAYCAIAQWDNDKAFDFDLINVLQDTLLYDFDIANMKQKIVQHGMYNGLKSSKEKAFIQDGLFKKTILSQPNFDVINKKLNITKQIVMNFCASLFNIEKSVDIDTVLRATKKRLLRMENNMVFQNSQDYLFDILIQLYAANLDMDILTQRSFPKRHGMVITLVGA